MNGLYIHVPFCRSKCNYCDFYSVAPENLKPYISAVLAAAEQYENERVDTVYFGGGNPLLLGADGLCGLLDGLGKIFHIEPNAEISLESNPEDVCDKSLEKLRCGGFNRISIGLQSLDDETLAILGRRHTAAQGLAALECAGKFFEHSSADIMLGLPGSTPKKDAECAAKLCRTPIDHLSAYMLKLEQGTPFFKRRDSLSLPDEDAYADSYLAVCSVAQQAGLMQYEISNFARAGGQCRHNLKYWKLAPYIGLGPAAAGFFGGRRYRYSRDLAGFIAAPDSVVADGNGGGSGEEIALSLRLSEGISSKRLRELVGDGGMEKLAQCFANWRRAGLLCDTENIALTPKGFLVSNGIISRILCENEE